VRIDDPSRTIFITTIQDVIEEGFFLRYDAVYDIYLPEDLLLGNVTIRVRQSVVEVDNLRLEDLTIQQTRGELFVYNIDATKLTFTSQRSKARVLDSYILSVVMNVDAGTILVNQLNDIITDGLFFTLRTTSVTTTINEAYYRHFIFETINGDVYLQNRNTLYQVESIEIASIEGTVSLPRQYESAVS